MQFGSVFPTGAFVACSLLPTHSTAQEDAADRAIRSELSEPFCYFSHPTDQIGFENCPKATILTYDGAFLSAYGQLSFYAGAPGSLRPISQRVKTSLDGYLPVIQFHFDRDGLQYNFEAFATPVNLDPRNNLITFIRCDVSNPGKSPLKGELGVNFGAIASKINTDPTYAWFEGQRESLDKCLEIQRSTAWHSRPFLNETRFKSDKSEVNFENGRLIQAGHLVCVAPTPNAQPGMPGYSSPNKEAAVQYDFSLKPSQHKSFLFKAPAVPIELSRPEPVSAIESANLADYRSKTIAFWKTEIGKADRFFVDDPKVMNTFKSSLVNDLIARELNEDANVYQRVNKIQYNYMWIRDSSFFTRTYDMLGLHKISADTLKDFLVWKDGKAVSFFKPGAPQPAGARLSVQDDYWGQVLWAVGAHYKTTDDQAFLKQVYPLLSGHIDEFVAKCKQDPRGLWPVAGPYDNEAINGHYTGHSFWALLGLKYAVFMATGMRRLDDVAKWQGIHDAYEANFMGQLRELAAKSEGYIPPGMDNVNDGNDWDNASGGIYPFEVLSSTDSLAKATLDMVRKFNYREGIITYGGNAWVAKNLKKEGKESPDGTLHHYEIFYVTESNTVLGQQRKVIEDLYSILAHTGSTNSGFEFMIPAWTTRDPGDNFTPHGWFASRYMSQIRDLLVREEGDQIHLASALSPQWIKAGHEIKVTDAPTFFGSVSYQMKFSADGATVGFSDHWKPNGAPKSLVLHTPWFVKLTSLSVDGKATPAPEGAIVLPPNTKSVKLGWSWVQNPDLSYDTAVKLYLEKYYHPAARGNSDFLFPQGD